MRRFIASIPKSARAEIPRGIQIARGVIVILMMLIALSAGAHESEEQFSDWYRSLKQNGSSSVSCCSYQGGNHDCGPVDSRITATGYEAMSDGEWIKIPDDKILKRENPTGMAVLCRMPISGTVLCFVPVSET